MLDWMLQQDDYIGHASLLTLCSPGGPPLGALNRINSVSNTLADITAVSNAVAGVDTVVSNLISSASPTVTAPVIPVATDSNGNVISNTAVASNTVITPIIPGVINTVGSVLSELTAAAGSVIPASITDSLGQLVPNPIGAPTILGDTLLPSAPTVMGDTLLPSALTIIGDTLMPLPVITDGAGDMPKAGPVVAIPGKDLTVSTAVTVTSAGCFNPEACPTIRSSRELTANSASAELISQTVKPGRPGTTVAGSERGDTTGTADRALPLTFTIGDLVFRPHPAGFSVDGTTISAGGRGVTIAGTVVQLESSGILKVGTNMISMSNTANLDDHLQLTAYSVGGQVFTPNWIAFPIASTIISAGGPGVSMAGTPIRLEASGILKIGTSVVSIANVASTTGHSWLTTHAVGTAIITPNPTTSAATGTTISAGGAGTTDPVTSIILGTSGDGERGGSTLTSTPKHPLQTSISPSGGHDNPIVRKRLRILFVMCLIYRIIAFL